MMWTMMAYKYKTWITTPLFGDNKILFNQLMAYKRGSKACTKAAPFSLFRKRCQLLISASTFDPLSFCTSDSKCTASMLTDGR